MAYAKKSGEKKDIQHKLIKSWVCSESEDGSSKSDFMTEAWVINGKETQAKLVRREFYNTKEGAWKAGKAKGLSQSDFIFILEHAREIAPTLGTPATSVEKFLLASNPEPAPAF